MSVLIDPLGRSFPYLRLSLTEACNFRCSYCLPDGYRADGRPQFLELDEIRRLLQGFAALGMHKLRLTGGEPSLRKDLPEIIAAAAAIKGVRKIALTTNGTRLPLNLPIWRAAGLTAANISVDSLDRANFARITGHDRLPEILEGIELAQQLDFDSIKLNAVLLRGLNEDELGPWLDYLRERPLSLRYIELMRTGDNAAYFDRHHLRAEHIEAQLRGAGWRQLDRAPDAGPACEWMHADYRGRVGIIAPYSRDFCAGCNRLRVTARGDLRLCLFGESGLPLRPLLQSDDQLDALVEAIRNSLRLKRAGHDLHSGRTGLTPHLASIGG